MNNRNTKLKSSSDTMITGLQMATNYL